MLMGLLAGFVAICIFLVILHLFQYLGLRMRNEAAAERDPYLGRKFVLHLFQHFAILLVLSGFTISSIDVTDSVLLPLGNKNAGPGGFGGGRGGLIFDEDSDDAFRNTTPPPQQWNPNGTFVPAPANKPKPAKNRWNTAQRFATGLILSGLLHGMVVFTILLLGTNNRQFPAVGRAFGLTRLVIAGIILMGCTTIIIVSILQKGSTDYRSVSLIIGFILVWGPTALGHLLWMRWTMNSPKKKYAAKSIGRERIAEEDEEDEDDADYRSRRRADDEPEGPSPKRAKRIPKLPLPSDDPSPRRNAITGELE